MGAGGEGGGFVLSEEGGGDDKGERNAGLVGASGAADAVGVGGRSGGEVEV